MNAAESHQSMRKGKLNENNKKFLFQEGKLKKGKVIQQNQWYRNKLF